MSQLKYFTAATGSPFTPSVVSGTTITVSSTTNLLAGMSVENVAAGINTTISSITNSTQFVVASATGITTSTALNIGTWVTATVGAQGNQGTAGTNGTQGAQGAQGSQGVTGATYTGMGYQGLALGGISVNVGETFPRQLTTGNTAGTTGRLKTGLIYLTAGQVVSNIRFVTATTAGSSLTGTWGGIFTISGTTLTLVAATAQQSLSTMAATTVFTWPIATIASGSSSTYTVPTSGIYYVGFCITGTPPTTVSTTLANGLYATTPYMSVYATGSTNPPAIGTTYSFAIDTILSYYALS